MPPNPAMPSFEQHCAEASVTVGARLEKVHRWLDEFAGHPPWGMRHRHLCHHQAGIGDVRRMWGDTASQIARQQILADLRLDGWTSSHPFPRNESEDIQMGLY